MYVYVPDYQLVMYVWYGSRNSGKANHEIRQPCCRLAFFCGSCILIRHVPIEPLAVLGFSNRDPPDLDIVRNRGFFEASSTSPLSLKLSNPRPIPKNDAMSLRLHHSPRAVQMSSALKEPT